MHDDAPTTPPLPEHPELREIALAMEGAGISGEILDANWQLVFISTEEARVVGVPPEEVAGLYGKSLVMRQIDDADDWGITPEVSRSWWRENVPVMRHYLTPRGGLRRGLRAAGRARRPGRSGRAPASRLATQLRVSRRAAPAADLARRCDVPGPAAR